MPNRPRRTKIVATLGPASDDPDTIARMIRAGVDVVRVNFSHGTAEQHVNVVELVRQKARENGREVGVLADLQGPKIRIQRFKDNMIELEEGGHFILDANLAPDGGDSERVGPCVSITA